MISKKLWEEFENVRWVLDELRRAADDFSFLSRFRTGLEFVEWFKSFISPILQVNYNTGAYWIRTTDLRGVVLWTRQGAWNEWAANSVLSRALTDYRDYIEPEFIDVLAHQVADEARHFYIRVKILELAGESLAGFQPLPQWMQLFEFPLKCAAERLERPYFQVKFSGAFQTVELTATVQHRGVVENAHLNKALWEGPARRVAEALVRFSREIEDDESFHWSIAERIWARFLSTPELMSEALKCAVPALELSTVAKIARIEAAEKARAAG
ncbi:hypothetical protein [Pyrobaculum ferrireducens]|uniref:Ferritin-like domain-containing protein n=1 Tax=Pyrobaculum ferrireducens TaxID=1104324 RepID=G7VHK4_9CREN|nr:hypothetical protein [Pyrobaculum ferrireducens]AET33295.1 hypothetical protein P186_1893 [Pyrobaculum ferrireducens]